MTVSLVVAPFFDPSKDRADFTLPAGLNLEEMVDRALPGLPSSLRRLVRVVVGAADMSEWAAIPSRIWRQVRPKPGRIVVLRIVPGDSGTLKGALSVAISIAAIAAGQFYLGPLLAGATGLSAGTASAIATAGLTFAGNFLLNALIPVKQKKDDQGSPTYDVQGWRNSSTPDGVIPMVLGRHRMAPPYAASPVTETFGNERYVSAIFLVGYGPVTIEDMRIGDTALSAFGDDVEMEVRYGNAGDADFSLYYETTLEEGVAAELVQNEPVTRTTAPDAAEISIDFHFPGGLFWVNDEGEERPTDTSVQVRYRLVGAPSWQTIGFSASDQTTQSFYRPLRFGVPTRGKYEVEVTCTRERNEKGSNRVDFACIRTHRPEYPINVDIPLAMVALRVRASKLANGVLDTFNCIVTSVCPDWEAPSGTWITRATRNPASLYRRVRQSAATLQPLADDDLNLPQLQDWHAFCAGRALTYDRIHDYSASAEEVALDVCAQGFATPQDQGSKWGVVIDRPQTLPVAAVSARNADAIETTISYPRLPDAFRVRFLDAANDYEDAERIVRRPGVVNASNFEDLQIVGETNAAMIHRRAIRRFYELDLRREEYSAKQDIEGLSMRRGDLGIWSIDTLVSSQVPARALGVQGLTIYLDEVVVMEASKTYAVRYTTADGTALLRQIVTLAGEARSVTLAAAAVMPEVDALVLFGELGNVAIEAVVKDVENGSDMSVTIRAVPHAPELLALFDAEIAPAWDGRVGRISTISLLPVAPPIIRVTSGDASRNNLFSSGSTPTTYPPVVVYLTPFSKRARVSGYELDYRVSGATAWTTRQIATAALSITIGAYAKGDALEFRARSKSPSGVAGPSSAILTHVVGSADPVIAPPVGMVATYDASTGTVQYSARAPNDAQVQKMQFRRAADGASYAASTVIDTQLANANDLRLGAEARGLGVWRYWAVMLHGYDIPSLPTAPVEVVIGGLELIANGDFASDSVWTKGAGWTIAGGSAAKSATGSASELGQSVGSLTATALYRLSYTIVSIGGGSVVPIVRAGGDVLLDAQTAPGTYGQTFTAGGGATTIAFRGDAGAAVSLDSISLKRVS